ncbi:MAG TPA: hypothetical protein VFY45_26370 [Baekduia sp.]|nr:hypothetical protein [Baekduia sp.]
MTRHLCVPEDLMENPMNNGMPRVASPALRLLVTRSVIALAAALCLSVACAGVASAASSGFYRAGAFAEAAPDGVPTHQSRIAVDHTSGQIFVTDDVNDQVGVYQPYSASGAYQATTFGAGVVTDPLGIAIDQATGDVYVSDAASVVKFTSDRAATPTLTQDVGFTSPTVSGPLAFDQTANQLLVADRTANVVRRFSTSGAAGATFDGAAGLGSPGAFSGLQDLAVDSTGDVLVVDSTGDPALGTGSARVERFAGNGTWEATIGPVAQAATIAVRPATDEVLVSGNQDAVSRNETPTLSVFSPTGALVSTSSLDTSVQYSTVSGIASDDGATEQLFVATDVDKAYGGSFGLASVQMYNGYLRSAPVVVAAAADAVRTRTATVHGTVNPKGLATTYWFEYGTTTAYGQASPSTQNADAGEGGIPVSVLRRLGDLPPDTTYHYRLVAHNALGTTMSGDATFTTAEDVGVPADAPQVTSAAGEVPGRGFLPDGRGWEMVSPVDKNYSDVYRNESRTHSSADGNAVSYLSVAGFGDVAGVPRSAEYLSRRDPAKGWTTTGITAPAQSNDSSFGKGGSFLDFNADLSRGVFTTFSAPLAAGAPLNTHNLYVRNNGKSPSYELITSVAPPSAGPSYEPAFAAASADLSHVLFESTAALTPNAPDDGLEKLYKSVNGGLSLVGILPDGQPAPLGSSAGPGAGAAQRTSFRLSHTISADGSRAFFTTGVAQSNGFVPRRGDLYLREGDTTTRIDRSRRSTPDPAGDGSSQFWDASEDGSKVYFTSCEQLTDDATGDCSAQVDDLYQYDVDADRLTLVSHDTEPADGTQANVKGVAALSPDGDYVYYVAAGAVIPGVSPPPQTYQLYVWHNGQTRHVGAISTADVDAVASVGTALMVSRVTSDGRHFLFRSSQPAIDAGYQFGGGANDVLLYDFGGPVARCISCPKSARYTSPNNVTTGASIGYYKAQYGAATTGMLSNPMSDDGSKAFFSSDQALVAGDGNGKSDVYEYDATTGKLMLLSSGQGNANSLFLTSGANGRDVFFITRDRLIGADGDGNFDLYDARVGGGWAEPPRPAAPCSADACQGAPDRPTPAPVSGTTIDRGTPAPVASRPGPIRVTRKSIRGGALALTVRVTGKGRIVVSGAHLRTVRRSVTKSGSYAVRVRLSAAAAKTLKRKHKLAVRARVQFTPAVGRSSSATASLTVKA